MIKLTRINGTEFTLNPFQIEMVEKTGDTVVQMASGRKFVVKEAVEDVQKRASQFLGTSVAYGIRMSQVQPGKPAGQ